MPAYFAYGITFAFSRGVSFMRLSFPRSETIIPANRNWRVASWAGGRKPINALFMISIVAEQKE